ncbi:MAG TPA: recombination protein RecR [Armatimonadetes bacterium]|nr:recombination protein RecR [Armatimonadota bacterium]
MWTPPLGKLIQELEKLPGVGPKTAQRLAFFILNMPEEEARALAEAILSAKRKIRKCQVCFNYTERDICEICSDPRRDRATICVVEQVSDLMAIERVGEYKGLYHVLHGLISPIDGVGPEDLTIPQLVERVRAGGIREVILATSATVEGDATSSYIADLIKPLGVKVTRIGLGIPAGGDLDYADQITILRAFEGRREL